MKRPALLLLIGFFFIGVDVVPAQNTQPEQQAKRLPPIEELRRIHKLTMLLELRRQALVLELWRKPEPGECKPQAPTGARACVH